MGIVYHIYKQPLPKHPPPIMNSSRVCAVKAEVQRALSTPTLACYAGVGLFYVRQFDLDIANVYVDLHADNVCRIRVVCHMPETVDWDAVLRASQTAPRTLRMESLSSISVTLAISNEVEQEKMLSDVASGVRAVLMQLGHEE